MAWIELHQALCTHRKLYDLADHLAISRAQAVGHLTLLWCWALDNAPDGTLGGVRDSVLARAADWSGDAQAFSNALESAGFVDRSGDELMLHDWADYGGKLCGKRAANAKRMRELRQAHREIDADNTEGAARADGVQRTCNAQPPHVQRTCNAREEKRREENQEPPLPPTPPGGGESLSDLEMTGDAPPVVRKSPAQGAGRRRRDVVRPQYSEAYLVAFNAYPNIRGCRDGKAGASTSFAALVGEEGYDAAELARAAGRYADHCRDPDARPVGIDRFYSRNAMHAGKSGRIFEQYLDDAAGAQKQSTIRTKGGKYDRYTLNPEEAYERLTGRKYRPDGGGDTGEPAAGPVGAADGGDGHQPGAVPVGVNGDAQRAVQPVPRPAGAGGLGVASVRFGAGPGAGLLPHGGVLPARTC